MEDVKKQNKLNNKQLKRIEPIDLSSHEGGILKFNPEQLCAMGEIKESQEHHNAGHALWYFNMMIYGLIHGKKRWGKETKTQRVIAHLACLREFLPCHEIRFNQVVSELLNQLVQEGPSSEAAWLSYIFRNWKLLREMAERYGETENCFPEKEYRKIRDLFYGRQWLRSWWWESCIQKTLRKIHNCKRLFQNQ